MTLNATATVVLLALLVSLSAQVGRVDAQSAASKQTWQGFVTDTHCGTNCQVTKDMKPDKQCVDRCARKGSKYGLWVGHGVFELEPQKEAARYAAKDVSVTGTLDGETIHIDSIKPINPPANKK
jgi:hypothetical protein